MKIVIRIIGCLLLLLALANLVGLILIEKGTLISPITIVARYSLMAVAGIGFIILRKWGIIIYIISVAINWVTYFTVYGGQGSAGSLWLSIPIPLVICILSYCAWSKLK